MPATRVYVTQLDKGLDTNIATSMIDEKSAVDLLNIKWNEGGIINKRDGFIDFAGSLTTPKALGRLQTAAGGNKILAIDGTELKATDSSTGTWTTISGATFNTNALYYQIPQIKKNSYIWNSVDAGAMFDGSALTRPGTMPSAGFSVYYKGYHICSGVASQSSRLYLSTIADTSDFTNLPATIIDGPDPDNATEVPGATVFTGALPDVAQFIDISPSDGEPITLLIEFQDVLLIGKTTSLWSMTFDTGTNKPVIQLITRSVGCVSNASGVAVGNDVYFLSEQGPVSAGNERNYAGALRTNLLAEKIKQILDGITVAQWRKTTATYHDRMYILSIPWNGSSTINMIMMLDTRFGGWSIWDTINAKSWLSHIDTSNKRHLYFIQEGATAVSEIIPGYYYDRYSAINAYWKSKAIDAGALDVTKRWTYLTLFMRNIGASATVTINTELEELEPLDVFSGLSTSGVGFNQWGSSSWLGLPSDINNGTESSISTTDEAWRTQPNLESRTITFQVSNNQAGENFFLSGFSAEYVSLKAYYFDQEHTF